MYKLHGCHNNDDISGLIRACAFYLVMHTDYIELSLDFEKEYYLCVSHRIRKHKTHY